VQTEKNTGKYLFKVYVTEKVKSVWQYPYVRFQENRMRNLEFCNENLYVCANSIFLLGSIGGEKQEDKPV
jgi:hypothetical protein